MNSKTVFFIMIGIIQSGILMAHPGHSLINPAGAGLGHFLSSFYHLSIGAIFVGLLLFFVVRYRKRLRNKLVDRNKTE